MKFALHSKAFVAVLFASFLSCLSFSQTITRGPYLQMATQTAITIRWRTSAGERFARKHANSRHLRVLRRSRAGRGDALLHRYGHRLCRRAWNVDELARQPSVAGFPIQGDRYRVATDGRIDARSSRSTLVSRRRWPSTRPTERRPPASPRPTAWTA